MATSGRGTGMVGYHVQTAVDARHHLVVAHEVTNQGHDRRQLANMARQAKAAIGGESLAVVADRGYFNGEEIAACERENTTTYLPRPQTSGNQAKGLFGQRDFVYHAEDDEYACPGGERLIYRFTRTDGGKEIRRYWSSACPHCPIKSQCTTGVYRRVSRWEHEAIMEALQERMDHEPERMKARRQTAEHPFGSIKAWMGSSHFAMRTLKHVRTELSLHALAYNLKRVMQIKGNAAPIAAIRA